MFGHEPGVVSFFAHAIISLRTLVSIGE